MNEMRNSRQSCCLMMLSLKSEEHLKDLMGKEGQGLEFCELTVMHE
jgi:hypothetical protein